MDKVLVEIAELENVDGVSGWSDWIVVRFSVVVVGLMNLFMTEQPVSRRRVGHGFEEVVHLLVIESFFAGVEGANGGFVFLLFDKHI